MSKQFQTRSTAATSFFCALILFSSVGCSNKPYSLAPVTGIVTVDGEPVADLKIVFYPKSSKENLAPGPFSTGKTDSEGKFSLVTRGGETGGVVGPHRVGFELPGNLDEEALGEAQSEYEELRAEPDSDPASLKAAKDNVAKIRQKLKGLAFVPIKYLNSPILEVEVPPEGLTNHAIELSKEN